MPKKKNTTRSDGRIAVQIYIGRVDGKRKYKTVYGNTQKEANTKADEIKAKLRRGLDISSGAKPFRFFSQAFLSAKYGDVGSVYYGGIAGKVSFWENAIGDFPVDKITLSELQPFIDSLAKKNPRTKKPTSKKTLIDYRMIVAAIFDLAIDNRAIEYNPAARLRIPRKAPVGKRDALDVKQQRWIRETDHRAQTAAMLMMCAGLRRGELLPLRWSDIDLSENGRISVTRYVEMIKGKPVLKSEGKTDAALRVIDYFGEGLIEYLRPLKKLHSPFEYVCPGKDGKMMSESAFRRMWESYLVDLNAKYGQPLGEKRSKFDPKGIPFTITRFTPHWLRHTYATMLFFDGIHELRASYLLGHSDIRTTINIYTHLRAIYGMQKSDASQMQVKDARQSQ